MAGIDAKGGLPDVDRGPSPGRRIDVGDRLRERPAVAAEVLGVVLPLAVRVVGRCIEDLGAGPGCPVVVTVRVLDPYEHGMRPTVGLGSSAVAEFDDDQCAVTEDELCAVVSDAQPLAEAEGLAKP